ncbi:cell adhesion molecule 1-like isoform X3 [Anneissia japonica]|uniref:cell adhesion molecule 1-like isoform X3 n=1 Tax=Anneissia japonica TaxID=1529436 RepID=UPI0014259FE1|nr:cell adhesion molecule 1-like isoform X3 [Anneissia japonica]
MHLIEGLLILLQLPIGLTVRFDAKPKDVNGYEGKTAKINCFLGDFIKEKHIVSWWKYDLKLSQQNEVIVFDKRISVYLDDLPYAGAYSYVLLIHDLILEDEGDYHCQIDESPIVSSGIARLTILQIPSTKYPKCKKSANTYVVGSQVKLTCISELISPPVELNWNHEGASVLPISIKTEVSDDLVYKHYTFIAKKSNNDDSFMCQQRTEVVPGIHNCSIQNLNIQYRPEVKIQHTSALFAGSDAILFCQSFANPPVTEFKWMFTPVLNVNEYIADGQVLTLIKPSIARNGTRITCLAENNIGASTDTMTVHITKEGTLEKNIYGNNNDSKNVSKTKNTTNMTEDSKGVSLYVVIIVIVLVVIIVVVVVIIPVYYHCFCKTRTATDSSGREIYQPTVYYDSRNRTSNSGLYDCSLPHLPSTGLYGHWRHSFASQVPEDLNQQGYVYIDERNGQNTL